MLDQGNVRYWAIAEGPFWGFLAHEPSAHSASAVAPPATITANVMVRNQ
jgi:hypothetical protein